MFGQRAVWGVKLVKGLHFANGGFEDSEGDYIEGGKEERKEGYEQVLGERYLGGDG